MEIVFALLGAMIVWVTATQLWTSRQQRVTRRALLVDQGGFDGMFASLGLEPARSTFESTETSGLGGALTLRFDCASVELLTASTPLTIELDLGDDVPSGVSMRMGVVGVAYTQNLTARLENGGTSEILELTGDERDTLTLKGSPLSDHLADVLLALPTTIPPSASMEGGVLKIQCTRTGFVLRDDDHTTLRALLLVLGALRDAMSDRGTEASELVRLVRSTSRSGAAPKLYGASVDVTTRWDAARVLCAHHADAPEVSAFAKVLADENRFTQAVCYRWGDLGGPFSDEPEVVVDALSSLCGHHALSSEINALLLKEYAWDALTNPKVPSFVRTDAAKEAWSTRVTKDERAKRDATLAELFTSREILDTLPLEVVFGDLTRSGWRPGPKTALAIATDGLGSSPTLLLDILEGIPDRQPYAGAIATLQKKGVRGASELYAMLDLSKANGRLSLAADDAALGGLSSAGERGGLTGIDG